MRNTKSETGLNGQTHGKVVLITSRLNRIVPSMSKTDNKEDGQEIFCRYIVRNGVRIYPKNGKFFHFIVKKKK